MQFDPASPYDGLPHLPPATEVETNAVLQQALRATRALAELKGAGGLIPDQSILINAIPLQEAKASSEIENIVTTQELERIGILTGEKIGRERVFRHPALVDVLGA